MAASLKGIVFDLDGTLVDSLSTSFDAFNHGITRFGGKKHTPLEILAYFGTSEGNIFAKILGPEKATPAAKAFREYVDENVHTMPLHAGVGELLEKLKSNDVPISIFTGRGWETTELILNHHRLMDRFITVITTDHVTSAKPSPEGLMICLNKMKMDPREVLMVGDSGYDMLAAQGAGSPSVAALWDLMAKREDLAKHHPHHFAEKPEQIFSLWEQLAVP